MGPAVNGGTRLVLVRHGEAICNVNGVVGGLRGCTGLTARGVAQAEALRDRLLRTGELGGGVALYASTLPRAVETAEIVASALAAYAGRPVPLVRDPDLCELRPGEADGLTWAQFSERFEAPDWDARPGEPLAPGGESWSGFVDRAAGALRRIVADAGGDRTIVAVCHAGVVEASLLRLLPVGPGRTRLGLRTAHASMTEWHVERDRWRLERYNDGTPAEVAQQA